MEMRNILVVLDPRASSASTLGPALDLAHRYRAKVSVCAAAAPKPPVGGAEMSPVAADECRKERREIEEGLTGLQAAFETTVPIDMRGRFRSVIGAPTSLVLDNLTFADLVLLNTNGLHGRLAHVDLGELVVSGGRPVLIVPEDTPLIQTRHIVVAWKDSREARRAVADALPFLQAANDVFVVCVEEGDYAVEHDSLKDVLRWMAAHDVNATGEIVPFRIDVHEAIEKAATEHQAEFIVSGGYGHTRFREWLLGGVTRELLADKTRCRLFSN